MKRKLLGLLIVAITLTAVVCGFSLAVSAKEAGPTVAYVIDSGAGTADGSSPENAAATLADAYDYLDLDKDCTVVICGPYIQWETFDYGTAYDGSVTITSVYDGIDWRSVNGAALKTMYVNFVLWGDTTFSYMNLEMISDSGMHLDCQFNDFTVGYGVNIIGDHLTGLHDALSLFVVGGYQNGKGEYSAGTNALDRDVNLKFYSGSNILVNIWSRGVSGETYTGTANVLFSGDASGNVFIGGLKTSNCVFGTTNLTVEANAMIQNIYGTASVDMTEKALNCYWYGGELLACVDNFRDDGMNVTFQEGKKLFASAAAKKGAAYADVSAWFNTVEDVEAPALTEHVPPVINVTGTEAASTGDPIATSGDNGDGTAPDATTPDNTDKPADSDGEQTEPTDNTGKTSDNDKKSTLPIIIGAVAAAVVIAAVVVIVIRSKKKK